MLPNVLDLGKGILRRNRVSLARAITLIESSVPSHREQAEMLLDYLAKEPREDLSRPMFTIGIAGPPGAGKSTFIEAMGLKLLARKHRLAVIPVDPSSHITGGSIMGDKTRMEALSKSEDAYIRASPTRGILGGVAEHTSDVLYLCSAAGYNSCSRNSKHYIHFALSSYRDHISLGIVESVGLGQSEVEIDQVVDMLLLVVPPGGGDDLQASKKGIVEAADIILVNKADGDLLPLARSTKSDYAGMSSRKFYLLTSIMTLNSKAHFDSSGGSIGSGFLK